MRFYLLELGGLLPCVVLAYVAIARARHGRAWPDLLQAIGAGLLASCLVAARVLMDQRYGILPRLYGYSHFPPWIATWLRIQLVLRPICYGAFALGYLAAFKGWWTSTGGDDGGPSATASRPSHERGDD